MDEAAHMKGLLVTMFWLLYIFCFKIASRVFTYQSEVNRSIAVNINGNVDQPEWHIFYTKSAGTAMSKFQYNKVIISMLTTFTKWHAYCQATRWTLPYADGAEMHAACLCMLMKYAQG